MIPSSQFPDPFDNDGSDSSRRAVVPPSHRSSIPPISPYSQIPTTRQPIGSQNFSPGPSLPRSMSQPSPVFSFDSLPPLSPSSSAFRDYPHDVALPPIPFMRSNSVRKAHRRSNSDNISGLNLLIPQNSPQLIYPKPIEMPVGVGEIKSHGEAMDDLLSAYMNLDNVGVLNSNNKNGDDLERNGNDSEASESGDRIASKSTLGVKRRAAKEIAPTRIHRRSISMDSGFSGKSSICDESQKLPPSPRNLQGTNSVDGSENALGLEVGNGMFTASEAKKIVGSNKLTELAAFNPKHVKRILANRESAARSKERKAQYISELEHKVQTLQIEATTLSAQFTHLQRGKMVLENKNKELRIRLQGMEQQAQLRDTLIEQLKGEVQRLKATTGQVTQNSSESEGSNMQSLSSNMLQQLSINHALE